MWNWLSVHSLQFHVVNYFLLRYSSKTWCRAIKTMIASLDCSMQFFPSKLPVIMTQCDVLLLVTCPRIMDCLILTQIASSLRELSFSRHLQCIVLITPPNLPCPQSIINQWSATSHTKLACNESPTHSTLLLHCASCIILLAYPLMVNTYK